MMMWVIRHLFVQKTLVCHTRLLARFSPTTTAATLLRLRRKPWDRRNAPAGVPPDKFPRRVPVSVRELDGSVEAAAAAFP
jgi:hypothetical protein